MNNRYQKEFIEAYNRTKKFNLKIEAPLIDSSENFHTLKNYEDLWRILNSQFPEFKNGGLALRCAGVSHYMKDIVSKYFDREVYITVGYYSIVDENKFYIDDQIISDLLEKKHHNEIIGFHVWLTLSSMEIIDFTFANSNSKTILGIPVDTFLFNNPNKMNEYLEYHPVLIGEDFLKRVGAIKD